MMRGILVSVLTMLFVASPIAPFSSGAERDAWTPSVTWRTPDGFYASAAHATLLPDGSVLCVGFKRNAEDASQATEAHRCVFRFRPPPLGLTVPTEIEVPEHHPPLDADPYVSLPYYVLDDLFCSGQTLLADGSVLTVGGTRHIIDTVTDASATVGMSYAMRYDGASWSREPQDMLAPGPTGAVGRWYPSCTRLPDGRVLVIGGYDMVEPTPSFQLSSEIYDPVTGAWQVHAPHGTAPAEISNADYTHAFVLPTPIGILDVMMFGQQGSPVLTSVEGPFSWLSSGLARPQTEAGTAPNQGASTVLLPIRVNDGSWGYQNGAVLMTGGGHGTTHQQAVDVYDPVVGAWQPRVNTNIPRHHPSTVLLPDGRVMIAAGHDMAGGDGVKRASFIDPRHDMAFSLGDSMIDEVRGYHTVSLLLPDGRVLVGGGRDTFTYTSAEKTNFRIYSPPYMFRPRPRITQAPAVMKPNILAVVESKGARPREVVLVALGSMTHSIDMNQRAVEVPILSSLPAGDGWVTAVAPPSDPRVAPPGHYMLFVVDRDRTPSQAAIVRVDT